MSVRCEQIVIRRGHPAYAGCAYVTQVARRIKNATHYLIRHRKKPDGKAVSHRDADKLLKSENPELYGKVPSAVAQRCTRIAGQEWKGFYAALKDWGKSPGKYKAKPNPPKYSYKASTCHIGRNGFRVDAGTLVFADSVIAPIKTRFKFSQNWNEKKGQNVAQEIRVVPKGACFVLEMVYDSALLCTDGQFSTLFDQQKHLGIDLGINNLMAVVSNQQELKPVLINGKPLKSVNAWYNRRAAKLASTGNWKHLKAVAFKRQCRIVDALHRASHFVRSYCQTHDIGLVVIGHNQGWKQDVNLGRVNNQKFVYIPHSVLINQIKYKCEAAGIAVVVNEESYTSKASALDNDSMPTKHAKPKPGENVESSEKKTVEEKPKFSGKRVKRGLYKTQWGAINADVNAAANILRKVTGDAFGPACRGAVFSPVTITLGSHPRTATRRGLGKQNCVLPNQVLEAKPIPIPELV